MAAYTAFCGTRLGMCSRFAVGNPSFRPRPGPDAASEPVVITFDKEKKGAIVLERMDKLGASIQRWLEKNMTCIDFIVPIEDSLITDPVQAMFCGQISRMHEAMASIDRLGLPVTVLRTEYPVRDLSIVDILNTGCSKGHALERWANHRGIPREQVMAIGDNYNDIEMLVFVPFLFGRDM